MAPRTTSLADFAGELRRFQEESGQPSIRDLVSLLRAAGRPYPKSTISDKLAGVSKPSWEFIEAFVRVCAQFRGWSAEAATDELATWETRFQELRRGIAAERSTARRTVDVASEPPPAAAVPQQLPPAVAGFTGRDQELSTLDALGNRPGSASLRIALLSGMAGAGKPNR